MFSTFQRQFSIPHLTHRLNQLPTSWLIFLTICANAQAGERARTKETTRSLNISSTSRDAIDKCDDSKPTDEKVTVGDLQTAALPRTHAPALQIDNASLSQQSKAAVAAAPGHASSNQGLGQCKRVGGEVKCHWPMDETSDGTEIGTLLSCAGRNWLAASLTCCELAVVVQRKQHAAAAAATAAAAPGGRSMIQNKFPPSIHPSIHPAAATELPPHTHATPPPSTSNALSRHSGAPQQRRLARDAERERKAFMTTYRPRCTLSARQTTRRISHLVAISSRSSMRMRRRGVHPVRIR
ncbi:hypothetical protein BKA81DRAFT_379945 [Phyllosticta paracitricarpa]|uniref:Uncharacterized protein n=1 Tax=Phyllosticta citricarpa TaxID=55181 RepID=A0ABR1MEN0_9PEZI